jgi:hypothetical protein
MIGHQERDQVSEESGFFGPALSPRRALRQPLERYRALDSCLSMIFSENRVTLFRIMLWSQDEQMTGRQR